MVRATRSSARRLETPSTTGTPSTTVSPIFSSKNSIVSSPPTSEDDDEEKQEEKEDEKPTLSRRRSTRTSAVRAPGPGKRAMAEDSDDEIMLSPPKKRATPMKKQAYVEIEVPKDTVSLSFIPGFL